MNALRAAMSVGLVLGLGLGSGLGSGLGLGGPATAGPLPDQVEQAARDRIAAGTYQTLVFGVADGDRSGIVAFGRLADGTAPDGDTVYEIGSVTKTVTATLLARAVLAGRVTLDTPVAGLLPDFRIPSRGRAITLADLATHRSGLPALPSNLRSDGQPNPFGGYDTAKLRAFLAHYELPRDPGAAFEYSDVGFGLLGHALAGLEHTTWEILASRAILEPLGMTTSGTASRAALNARLAPGHDSADRPAINWDIPGLAGTGALRSTARDMLRYLRANMAVDPSPLQAAMSLAHQPRDALDATTRIGLAWRISPAGIVWHPGMTWGHRSFVGFTADRRRGVVILSNTAADADDLGFATLDAAAPLAPAVRAIALPAAALDDYEGTYRLGASLLTVFRMNDGLFMRATGQGAFPVLPSARDEFFAKAFGIGLSFTRGTDGAVNGLVLHNNGDHPAARLATSELPPGSREIALDAALLGDYVGRYRGAFGALEVMRDGDRLAAQVSGQPAYRIFPSAPDRFFYKIVEAELAFERDAGGTVAAVVLHQNGGRFRASHVTD
jgi:CubicO group peptidase (beta-lactamase class C family)